MDREVWSNYKKEINERYRSISVVFEDIQITLGDTRALVKFKQYYRANEYTDYWVKLLVLTQENGRWKIGRITVRGVAKRMSCRNLSRK